MNKRYQVFVSSTYEDLIKERQEVMHALLELDCIPAGMELFSAANDDQWTAIKRAINECDYYIVIIAGRYGSTDASGMSYTEKEYRYAVDTGKPVIAFLHQNPGSIPSDHVDVDQLQRKKLGDFLSLVKQRMCKYWSTPDGLGSVVSRSLIQLLKNNPAVGWVRADQLADEDALQEIVRLTRHVQELESEIAKWQTTAPKGTEILAQGEDRISISYSFIEYDGQPEVVDRGIDKMSFTWDEIFGSISPVLLNEATENDMRIKIEHFIVSRVMLNPALPYAERFYVTIDSIDFDTIIIQLKALGLIIPIAKSGNTCWKLTPYGESYMTNIRAIKRGVP